MPANHGHVAVEIEHHPVHPAGAEAVQSGESRLGLLELIGGQQAHHLDRHGGDVEVGRVVESAPVSDDADMGHSAIARVDGLDLMLGPVVDSHVLGAQVLQPGADAGFRSREERSAAHWYHPP